MGGDGGHADDTGSGSGSDGGSGSGRERCGNVVVLFCAWLSLISYVLLSFRSHACGSHVLLAFNRRFARFLRSHGPRAFLAYPFIPVIYPQIHFFVVVG